MANYLKVTYSVQYTEVVDLDEHDGVAEDAISDIFIPETEGSGYVEGTFQVIKTEKVRNKSGGMSDADR
jgi:hypothetical protein